MKAHITKPAISMCPWRLPMRAAPQGAFVDIPETSHGDVSFITKNAGMQKMGKVSRRKHAKKHIQKKTF